MADDRRQLQYTPLWAAKPEQERSNFEAFIDLVVRLRTIERWGVGVPLQPVPVQRGDIGGAGALHPGGPPGAVQAGLWDAGPDADGERILPVSRAGRSGRVSIVRRRRSRCSHRLSPPLQPTVDINRAQGIWRGLHGHGKNSASVENLRKWLGNGLAIRHAPTFSDISAQQGRHALHRLSGGGSADGCRRHKAGPTVSFVSPLYMQS